MKTVLVVDDSRVARMMTRLHILKVHADWVIEEAGTGEEAIEKVKGMQPFLILLDVNMPGMGGLAAGEVLRSACPDAHMFLVTANVQNATRTRAVELGIGFVEKPMTEDRIVQLITNLE